MMLPSCLIIISTIMQNKVILVTGANGQLGNEMRQVSQKSQKTYLFTDVAELDITDKQAVSRFVKENGVTTIVNCAAYTQVDKAEEDEKNAWLLNCSATNNLAEAAKEQKALLIHISTDYVFSGNKCTPYVEEDLPNPYSIYGKTKLAGEEMIQKSGCHYMIFRTSWLYSEYGNNFVKTMLRLTKEKELLNVVFDQVGTPTYAADLAKLIFDILEKNEWKEEQEGIYHFSNEGVCSWYDFAKTIAAFAGHSNCKILPCDSSQFPSKVKRPNFSVLDKRKVRNTFDWDIPYWQEALVRCLERLSVLCK